MNFNRRGLIISLILLLAVVNNAFAQQVGIDSPYSRYGYGLLSDPSPGASEAMGGISYGLRRSQQVNPGNPASYSELDTLTFIFDIGVSGQIATFNDGNSKKNYVNGNFDYLAIQFPLFKKMGASLGLLPYSKMGYNFGRARSTASIQNIESYRGTGGLNKLYGGIAYAPISNLSIGTNIAFLFGQFSMSNVVTPIAADALTGETKLSYSVRNLMYDFGIQYKYQLNNSNSITLGAVYTPQINFKTDVNPAKLLFNSDPYQTPNQQPVQIVDTDTLKSAQFALPNSFGLGFTYATQNMLIGLDGTYQLWKGLNFPDIIDNHSNDSRFNNRYRVSAGAEYIVDPYSSNFLNQIRFRAGLSFANSYSNFHISDINTGENLGTGSFNEYGVTVGVGLPFVHFLSRRMSMLNINFGYTRHQPNHKSLIAQNEFKLSINMNVNEFWFFKRQFD